MQIQRTKKPRKRNLSYKKTRPKSTCTKEIIKAVPSLCKIGLTDAQIAEYLNVTVDTLHYWKKTNEAFASAMDRGRMKATQKVADSLYQQAKGYHVPAVKHFKIRHTEKEYDPDGKVIKERSWDEIIDHPYMHYYPPQYKATIKVLAARHPEVWGETYRVDHRHAHLHQIMEPSLQTEDILEQITDSKEFTDEELRLAAKIGLIERNKAAQEEEDQE